MTTTVTNAAATLSPQPELFERFRYYYEVLYGHLRMELDARQFEAQLSLLSVPDARFNHLAAVKVCFCGHSWLIGGVADGTIDCWGIAAEGQNRVKRHDDIAGVVTDLLRRVEGLAQSKADQLKADWENAFIQAEVAELLQTRQFQWPVGLTLTLYEWKWTYWVTDGGDEEMFTKWSLVDHSDDDGYAPFIPEWHDQKQGYCDMIKLPATAEPIIKRVEISCFQDLPSGLKSSGRFTVGGVFSKDGTNYVYRAGGEAGVRFESPGKLVQDAIRALQAQQSAAPEGQI